jgi:ABC-type nitrate/sulfonate/bicarbonate transport system substrate-binding protein
MRRVMLGALVLFGLIALVACGDDDDATPTSQASPTSEATGTAAPSGTMEATSTAEATATEAAPMRSVSVMLDWTPNTNHIGVYAAKEQGWYEEAGLDVSIIEPAAAGVDVVVAEGQADFGFSYSESVLPARQAGVGVTSIATVLPHNDSSLMMLASDGVTRPADLEGKKYGGFGGLLETQLVETLVACDGGDPSQVEFVEVGNIDYIPGMEQDRFDFVWVFEGWDVIRARNLDGVEITTLPFIDYTDCIPDWYTPVIVAGDDLIADDPELVRTFLEVTARGYDFAAAEPDEAATMLLEAAPELDETLVRDSAAYLADKFTDGGGWGQQQEEIWTGFADFLLQAGLLEDEVDANEAFTNEFLPS